GLACEQLRSRGSNAEHANGPGNVFQDRKSVVQGESGGRRADRMHQDNRYQNLSGLRKRVQARGDRDAISVHVIAMHNHTDEIDCDSKAKAERRERPLMTLSGKPWQSSAIASP